MVTGHRYRLPPEMPRVTVGLTDQCKTGPVTGCCLMCGAEGVPVIWLGPVNLPGATVPYTGCEPCVRALYQRAKAAAA